MGVIEAGIDIIDISDTGFVVNTNNMELEQMYSFKFLDSEYLIETNGNGSLPLQNKLVIRY